MGSNTRKKKFLIGIFLLAVVHLSQAQANKQPLDTVITNGHIIDGTGSPWYSGDIGIRSGKIAAIGNLSGSQRTRTIDVHGMVVAPGFIDMLGQSELTILVDPRLPSKIYQGITTEITGEGGSIAPLNDAIIKADRSGYDHYHITPDWRSFRQYFARLEKQGMGINLASYVGATQVREAVIGEVHGQVLAHDGQPDDGDVTLCCHDESLHGGFLHAQGLEDLGPASDLVNHPVKLRRVGRRGASL